MPNTKYGNYTVTYILDKIERWLLEHKNNIIPSKSKHECVWTMIRISGRFRTYRSATEEIEVDEFGLFGFD